MLQTSRKQLSLLVLLFICFGLVQPALAADRIEIMPNSDGPMAGLVEAGHSPFYLYALKHASNGAAFTACEYKNWQEGDKLYVQEGIKPNRAKSYALIAKGCVGEGPKPAPSTPLPLTCPPSTLSLDVQASLKAANDKFATLQKLIDDKAAAAATEKARLEDKIGKLEGENAEIPVLLGRIATLEAKLKGQTQNPPNPPAPAPKGSQNVKTDGKVLWGALGFLLLVMMLVIVLKRISNRAAGPTGPTYTLTGQPTHLSESSEVRVEQEEEDGVYHL